MCRLDTLQKEQALTTHDQASRLDGVKRELLDEVKRCGARQQTLRLQDLEHSRRAFARAIEEVDAFAREASILESLSFEGMNARHNIIKDASVELANGSSTIVTRPMQACVSETGWRQPMVSFGYLAKQVLASLR